MSNLFNQFIEPGSTYVCTKSWKNEMDYQWKCGEMVVVVKNNDYSVGVREPKQVQYFEIMLDIFNECFSKVN